jgi:hypothetical protein
LTDASVDLCEEAEDWEEAGHRTPGPPCVHFRRELMGSNMLQVCVRLPQKCWVNFWVNTQIFEDQNI